MTRPIFSTSSRRRDRNGDSHDLPRSVQTAVPGRPCGEPAAPARNPPGAGQRGGGRDDRGRARGDRGPLHPRRGPEAGGGRAQGGHRRRVPPRGLALRLPLRPRRHRAVGAAPGADLQGRAGRRLAGGQRQDPQPGRGHARPFPLPERAHGGDRQVLHPLAEPRLSPQRPRPDRPRRLPRARRLPRGPLRRLPGRAVHAPRGGLPLSPARRHHLRHAVRSQGARPDVGAGRRPGGADPDLCPRHRRGGPGPAGRHDRHRPHVPTAVRFRFG